MNATPPGSANDVVSRLLALLDNLIDTLHDKVLRPITIAGRTVAFGFILLLVGILVFVALLVGVVRLLDVYAFSAHQWLSFVIVGGVLVGGGLFVWRLRSPAKSKK